MPRCLSLCGMTARRVLPILAMIATAQAFAPNLASAHRAASPRFAASTTRMSATRPRAVASRRMAIAAVASTLSILGSTVQPASAAQGVARGEGIIPRINEPTLKRVEGARLEDEDIFYPRAFGTSARALRNFCVETGGWMAGLWNVTSVTTSVEAPLGDMLFGRPGALEQAQKEVGTSLSYQARFRRGNKGRLIADRQFNVESISRAALGGGSVLESVVQDGANKIVMTLVPSGAGGRVFVADLKVTARDATSDEGEGADGGIFACTETSRQSVAEQKDPVQGTIGVEKVSIPRGPKVSEKDIEVLQVFEGGEVLKGGTRFKSTQRIATYITQDQFKQMLRARAVKGTGLADLYEKAKTQPIDVRTYEITYDLIRRPRSG